MEANKYCQCCGMPLTDGDMLSREADGTTTANGAMRTGSSPMTARRSCWIS